MHAAPLTSPRLQGVLRVLADGKEHTTRDIVRRAKVMAVSACVAELRTHGADIVCRQEMRGEPPIRVWLYRMIEGPKT